jgi:serine/alanine racemase
MESKKNLGGLDLFRIIAAFLVVAIHISPLENLSAEGDFFFTKLLARLAVPFFFMVSGHFVLSGKPDGEKILRFLKKILLLYFISILLYLPIGLYAGHYTGIGIPQALKMLFFDGPFYHLWYFPALILGVLIVALLKRFSSDKLTLIITYLLYLLGLLGDGYWGLIQDLPVISNAYGAFFTVSSYTRGGIFLAPLFLFLGTQMGKAPAKKPTRFAIGFAISFALMTAEGFLLRHLAWQRHTSMYLLLPLCVFFLYGLLLCAPLPQRKNWRTVSTWIYILHPAVIVALRVGARVIGLSALLVDNLLIHYLVVCILSFAIAYCISLLPCFAPKADPRARAWAELDRNALAHNVKELRSIIPSQCELMPAVKANAYGHGAIPISKELNRLGVKAFCVASLAEGVELRCGGVKGKILVLGYTHPKDLPLLRRYRLIQAVVDRAYAEELKKFKKTLHVHIAIDTGMKRLGEWWENQDAICEIFAIKNLKIDGVFTHLCADDTEKAEDVAFTEAQAGAFESVVNAIKAKGYSIPKLHTQASYGILNYPSLAGDYARVGIALYGVRSQESDLDRAKLHLKPVLSLKARVSAVKKLHKGDVAGYGLDFVAQRETTLATLTIGYADGVPRSLSGGVGEILIHGKRAPIAGRICMDQLSIDITDIQGVKAGDVVTLIGSDGEQTISAYEWAQKCGTLTNEILSRLGERPERVIK